MVYRYRTHIRAHILQTIVDRVQHIDKRLVRDGKRWIVQPLGYALGLGEVLQPLLDLLARVAEARLILQQTFAGLMQRGRFLRHKVKLLRQLAERIERYVDLLHHLVAFAGARSELLVVLQVHIVKVFENFGIDRVVPGQKVLRGIDDAGGLFELLQRSRQLAGWRLLVLVG